MSKVKDNVWSIFGQGIELYFTNLGSFFRYMAFPVFGQILGIFLILVASYFYAANLPNWIVPGGIFDNFLMIFLVLFLITLPGLIVLIKAFWDYLVAYGAINSMLENMLKSGKVYDFHAHTEVITRRSGSFGTLWVILAILGVIGSFPLFWVVAGILSVYFVLIFQVFTFEPNKSAFGCFERSMNLVKGHFWQTLWLMILLGILTYWVFPDGIKFLLNITNIIGILAMPLDAWTSQLPIKGINQLLLKTPSAYQITSLWVAKSILEMFLGYIITCLTLPLRSICCALWYKKLSEKEKVKSEK